MTLVEIERRHIRTVLDTTRWRIEGGGGAAQLLGLKPSTLRSRMLKLGMRGRAEEMLRAESECDRIGFTHIQHTAFSIVTMLS